MQMPGLRQLLRSQQVLADHPFANRSLELRWKSLTLTLRPRPVRKPADEGNDIGELPNLGAGDGFDQYGAKVQLETDGPGGGKGSLGHTGGLSTVTTGRFNFQQVLSALPSRVRQTCVT